MYPNLRYAFYDLLGLDISALGLVQSFGFWMALSFIISAWWLVVEFRRRESLGLIQGVEQTTIVGQPVKPMDLIINALIGFFLGFKGVYALMHADLFASDQAKNVLLSWEHGNWIAGILGALGMAGWKYWEKKRETEQHGGQKELKQMVFPHQRVGDIVMMAAISGIAGAKGLYLMEYATAETFWDELFSGSGLTVYGGLILAFVVVSAYIVPKGVPFLQLIDTAAPTMILAYGVGRLGCHFSGDGDWGCANPHPKPFSWLPDWLWAYRYPNNVIKEGIPLENCGYPADFGDYCTILPEAVYPTPVWEFLAGVAIFFILYKLRTRAKVGGLLFCIYLIFNGLERFLIELIRINDKYAVSGFSLSQAQYIAMVLFGIGLVGTIWLGLKQRQQSASA